MTYSFSLTDYYFCSISVITISGFASACLRCADDKKYKITDYLFITNLFCLTTISTGCAIRLLLNK